MHRLVPGRLSIAVAAVITLLVGLAAAGCRGDDSSEADDDPPTSAAESSTRPPPKPKEPKPREGACHDLSVRQISRAHDKRLPVRCRKPHTTQTFHVGHFKLTTSIDETPDTSAVAAYVTPKCTRHFKRWVGGDRTTRLLTRAHPVWFVPTTRDIKLGARWYRCDVVVSATESRLEELPRNSEGLLDSSSAMEEYGLCSRGSPQRSNSETVSCGRHHTWRAFDVIRVEGKSDRHPSRKRLRKTGDRCQDRARVELDYPLEWKYGWQPPTRAQWKAGVRWGICWVPTD